MLMACTLGRSFGIVSFSRSLEPWFAEIVAWHGMTRPLRRHPHPRRRLSLDRRRAGREGDRCWSISPAHRDRNDAADVVILAGAPLAGLANKIRDRVPVPLVDGIQAAVAMAEGLVRMKPRKATAGTYRRPDAKDFKGLSTALANVIGHS